MSKKIQIVQQAKLHNEFRIVVTDARTGKVKQEARAYNIIVDEGLRRWVRALCTAVSIGASSKYYRMMIPSTTGTDESRNLCFGGQIQVGTGDGTLSPSRTTLFAPLGRLDTAFFNDRMLDAEAGIGKYTQRASSIAGQFAGNSISEVGLCPINGTLSTHALIEDAEGASLSVDIEEFDILTIYATTYIKIGHSYGSNFGMVSGADGNILLRMVADNASVTGAYHALAGGATYRPNCYLRLGKSSAAVEFSDAAVISEVASKLLEQGVADLPNFKAVFEIPRFEPAVGNNPTGIREIGATLQIGRGNMTQFGPIGHIPLFRSVLPIPGVWEGYDFEDEEIGTGDGETVGFSFEWGDWVADSEVIKVNGVPQTRGVDYEAYQGAPAGANSFQWYDNLESFIVGSTSQITDLTNACDGNTGTYAYVDVGSGGRTLTNPRGIIISREFADTCNKFRIYQGVTGNYTVADFKLEGSLDGSSWDLILEDVVPNTIGWHEFSFSPVAYKYWKLTILGTYGTDLSYYGSTRLYEVELIASKHHITFLPGSIPAQGAAITADYHIDYIPKDSDRVLDVSFAIQFSDGGGL